jgi:hypothetical protein
MAATAARAARHACETAAVRLAWLAALGSLALACPRLARAHMAPSQDANNRYLKVTPLADGVRLAYTIYFGEVPGRRLRAEIDRDRDGQLAPGELDAWAARLAREVAGGLELRLDDRVEPVVWRSVDVGLGEPVVAGGSFAVDFIAWRCAPADGDHRLELYDRVPVPALGDTELRVEPSAGVTVTRIALGGDTLEPHATLPRRAIGTALTSEPWRITFRAGPDAQRAACAAPATNRAAPASRTTVGLIAAVVVALGVIGGLAWRRRRRLTA